MNGTLAGTNYYAPQLDVNKKFFFTPGDHKGQSDAERAAREYGTTIAAEREAKAGRPLTRTEMIHGLGYDLRDNWQPVLRPQDKFDAAIEQLNGPEYATESLGKLNRMTLPERLAYWARKAQGQQEGAIEAASEQPVADPKLDELRQFREQIKWDATYSDSERTVLNRAIAQREHTRGVPEESENLYRQVKENQQNRVAAESAVVEAQIAGASNRLAQLREQQAAIAASVATEANE